jgi:3-hydroxyacyl-CoA dehydrogenase/enoyl-CoA hydratase/3-hydroxybutyryl-CoA epimerase
MRHIRIERDVSDFPTVILDNADETMNVVSEAWLTEMTEVIAALQADETVKGIVITSGKRAFMAGADLNALVNAYGKMTPTQAYAFSQRATAMHRALETIGKPVVAALNGLCLGGGFELALACHYRVLADEPDAVVGLPEVNVGLLPGSGGTQRLPRLIGVKAALELLLSGRSVAPGEALALRMVDAVVPRHEVIAKARQLLTGATDAQRPWDKKGFGLPESRGLILPETAVMFTTATAGVVARTGYNTPAPAAILSCVFEGIQLPFDRALSIESKYFSKLLTHPVARNLIRTGFIAKQAAEKGARRPPGIPARPVKKIGILGAGMMGAGIALVSAKAGIDVVLIDRDQASAHSGKDRCAKLLEKTPAGKGSAQDVLHRITATDDYGLLADVNLVVEAVFEDLETKADVTRKAEAVLAPTTIFSSNTSTLPITRLAQASRRPEQFIGLHFFSPVERMGLVEVIRGRQTSKETLAHALDFIKQLRKTPIVVNDSRGFYTSRVFQTFIHEGAAMLGEGIEPARIENAAKAAGFPIGPLGLLDEVTMDLPLKIVEQALQQEGKKFAVPAGTPIMQRMQQEGRSGRKRGGGFYEYPQDAKKRLWPGLARLYPASPQQPAQEELKARFLYVQSVETTRCLEEGVLETVQDADLGAVLGWGFPPWTGGTISYIDTVGVDVFMHEADRLTSLHGPRFAPSGWLREKARAGAGLY